MTAHVEEILNEIAARRRIPCATYRFQFGRDFTFRDAQALVPYLNDLGVSDCYASPLFKPCSDSGHGYDICDHGELNPSVGTRDDFDSFARARGAHDMGLILDVVPNHMGIAGARNAWWRDVLENGPCSGFSRYFDIDWHPVNPELENKVLLPILEDQYGRVLESGKLRLAFEEGAFFLYYYENKLPVAPRTYSRILGKALQALLETLGEENDHLQEFLSILTALNYLPLRTEEDPERIEERKREKEIIKRRIASLYGEIPEVRSEIDKQVELFNGTPGDPRSFDLLDALIEDQAYRPAFWRVAADEINYRRFFDINHLAAIRMELPEVFQETHRLIFEMIEEGSVTGLRIDHPDGLWNPADYFRDLQRCGLLHKIRARLALPAAPEDASRWRQIEQAVDQWIRNRFDAREPSSPCGPLYVVAEKILCGEEELPADWTVCGTTGYDFLNAANGLFVDAGNSRQIDRIYANFIGSAISFPNLINSSKKMIMLVSLASEITSLSHDLERISEKNRRYRDFTLNSLVFGVREIVACLAVYRTYITDPANTPPRDQACIEAATEEAKRRNPRTAEALFDFIRDTLLLRNLRDFPDQDREKLVNFVMEFQQVTGPVMAKGLEDTAFYVYNRLVSLNEVGGHPDRFGIPPAEFHKRNAQRQQKWPHSLLATSTHDTKRSEDVRARINVLSEIPAEWKAALGRWSRLHASRKTLVDGKPAPDRNDEYMLYQTLAGAFPVGSVTPDEFSEFRDRIAAYMHKAILEAKVHTSWVNPNEEYEAAVRNFVCRVLEDRKPNRFLRELQAFADRVAFFGRFNSLSQVLLKLTSPGVPDTYQGTELWDLSLVDPDNRRPVDYPLRRRLLDELKQRVEQAGPDLLPLAAELLETSRDGRIKLYLIYRTLNFRRDRNRLFSSGAYIPLEAGGEKADHVCAFARQHERDRAIVVVPRLPVRLTGGVERPPTGEAVWKDTWLALPPGAAGRTYRNLLTGETLSAEAREGGPGLRLSAILSHFPVGLLEKTEP